MRVSVIFKFVSQFAKKKLSAFAELSFMVQQMKPNPNRKCLLLRLVFDGFYTLVITCQPISWARTTNWNFYLCCHVIT